MCFPISNFEGKFSTYVFSNSFWHYLELKCECWTSRHILCEKILNFFEWIEDIILVKKWNIYEAHIFPRPLLQTCRLETTSLCLNARLLEKKNSKFSFFFEINVNFCLLCVHVMTSIILHPRRPNCQ